MPGLHLTIGGPVYAAWQEKPSRNLACLLSFEKTEGATYGTEHPACRYELCEFCEEHEGDKNITNYPQAENTLI